MKYVIVTGGVTSSLGKGVVTATIGRLLKATGYNVILQKFDPYLNVNPGTLSPAQHGEVFVTADGGESDLDLGHYERFCDIKLTKASDITTGQIYQSVLEKERKGDYLGSTVQVIPHITDEIKNRLYHDDKEADITITEIGGTVGDIEGLPFLEAVRQVKNEVGSDNVVYVHVTLVPTVISEVKTKPTQHSVKELRSIGIQPDILICRTSSYGCLTDDMKRKISLFCNVDVNAIFENHDLATIYELPRILYEQGLDEVLLQKLDLPERDSDLDVFTDIGFKIRSLWLSPHKQIAVIGQFASLPDAYISTIEALKHSFLATGEEAKIELISTKELEDWSETSEVLDPYDGIVIVGDLSEQSIQGKISAVSWARKISLPCFGIDDGFYAMILEAVKEDLFKDSNGIAAKDYKIFETMDSLILGEHNVSVKSGTKVSDIYGRVQTVTERYRNHLKLNSDCRDILEERGLHRVGISSYNLAVDIIEREDHPWFIGCQFHPEFKSRPDRPHPLFNSFVRAVQEV